MQNDNFTHSTGIESAELERELEAKHKEILEQAQERARHFGKKNKPDPKGDSIEVYISEFRAKYEAMVAKVHQHLQGQTAGEERGMKQEETNRKVKTVQKKRDDIQQNKHNYEMELESRGINPDDLAKLEPKKSSFSLLVVAICIGEAILNTGALQLLGSSWIASLLISISITGGLYILSTQLAKHLKEGSGGRWKMLITVVGVFLALGTFYMLATLRSTQLESEGLSINPIFLIVINLLLFVVTTWHLYRQYRSPEEESKERELLQCKEKLDGFTNGIKDCEEEEKKILEHNDSTQKFLMHLPGYVQWLNNRIQRWFWETIEAFKSTNMIHRSDSKTPDCFRDNYYPPLNTK